MTEGLSMMHETLGGSNRGGGACAVLAMMLALFTAGCGDSGERAAGEMLGALERGKITGTRGTMEAIAQGLRSYSVDHSGYPESDSIQDLMAELVPAHMRAATITTDAWGRSLSYRGESQSFTLVSGGQDGRIGTDDDIVMVDGRFEALP
jgi:hypothetical protein